MKLIFFILSILSASNLKSQNTWQFNLRELETLHSSSASTANDFLLTKGFAFYKSKQGSNGKELDYCCMVAGHSVAAFKLRYYTNNTQVAMFSYDSKVQYLNLKRQLDNSAYKLEKQIFPDENSMGFSYENSYCTIIILQHSSGASVYDFIIASKGTFSNF